MLCGLGILQKKKENYNMVGKKTKIWLDHILWHAEIKKIYFVSQ